LNADVIISGVGKPGLVKKDMVKDEVVVIDYGFGKKPFDPAQGENSSRIFGDVDFDSVSKKASLITPVPGGMGPLVIVAVLQNLVMLAK
jgi:methylenetetrahydrofolate dehydrogenase (NADP+)/methenyltetrahydrofolate cyclohydrolase